MIFPTFALVLAASSIVSALPIQRRASLPRLGGVNIAGLDFGMTVWGWSGSYVRPDVSQIAHFASLGANAFRIPFGWQYIQPNLGGELDASFAAALDTYVQAALKTGGYAILDLHNYARLNSGVIGVDGPSNAQFADLWSRLAKKYASQPNVIFGLMNEPHDLANFPGFVTSLQGAVTAIRAAGATSQSILLPGNDWTHAASMISTSGPLLLGIKDTSSDSSKLLIDIHQYLDSDGSGTHTECTTDNVALFTQLSVWLKSVGRQAIVSETGAANNAGCITALGNELKYVASNSDTLLGFTIWSAGAFAPSPGYELSIVPNSDGSDNDLVKQAIAPYFPGTSPSKVTPTTSSVVLVVVPTTSSIAPKPTTSSEAAVTPTTSSVAAVKPTTTSIAAVPTTSSVASVPTITSVSPEPTSTSVAPVVVPTTSSTAPIVVVPTATSTAVVVPETSSVAPVEPTTSSVAPVASPTSVSVEVPTPSVASTSTEKVATTSVAPVPAVTASSSAAAASPTSGAPDLGLQTYTGHLGGIYAIPVTVGGRGYLIGDESVSTGELYTALSKSCDKQHNLCANAANAGRNLVYSVGDCDVQNNACKAAISV